MSDFSNLLRTFLTAVFLILVSPFNLDQGTADASRDVFYRASSVSYPSDNSPKVAVVVIREEDLSGRSWPAPYNFHTLALAKILAAKPKAVFVDLAFIDERLEDPINGLIDVFQRYRSSDIPITYDQWDMCVTAKACEVPQRVEPWAKGRFPVMGISWLEAKAYLKWLSRKTDKSYRLLTEAEWEYMARAGTTTSYSWGDAVGKGNVNCDMCGTGSRRPALIGSFPPNAWGLYDTHGNASEWVEDCYHPNFLNAPTNGSAWTGGKCETRTIRGGYHDADLPIRLRVAFRSHSKPTAKISNVGFRVARNLAP